MNNYLYGLLGIVIGGIAGAAGGYFFAKKKYDKLNEKDSEDLRKYYEKKYSKEPQATAEEIKAPEEYIKDAEEIGPSEKTLAKSNSTYIRRKDRIDYTTMYDHDVDPAENEHPLDDGEENHLDGLYLTNEAEKAKKKGPYLIKNEDFGSVPYCRQQTLLYYTEDDTLTIQDDQNEDILDDFDEIESMLGDTLDKIGFKDTDQKKVCVRNAAQGYDYEIIKVFAAYGDTV